jgi:hypothetical protein
MTSSANCAIEASKSHDFEQAAPQTKHGIIREHANLMRLWFLQMCFAAMPLRVATAPLTDEEASAVAAAAIFFSSDLSRGLLGDNDVSAAAALAAELPSTAVHTKSPIGYKQRSVAPLAGHHSSISMRPRFLCTSAPDAITIGRA